jgi:hypothetical protein
MGKQPTAPTLRYGYRHSENENAKKLAPYGSTHTVTVLRARVLISPPITQVTVHQSRRESRGSLGLLGVDQDELPKHTFCRIVSR